MSRSGGRSAWVAVAGAALPEQSGVSLEVEQQAGLFEAQGVVVAPALEVQQVLEVHGLEVAHALLGNLFAFHIEASLVMLKADPQVTAWAAPVHRTCGGVCG
jgi:hypothetical protein